MTDSTGPVDANNSLLPRVIPPQEADDVDDIAAPADVAPAPVRPAEQLGFQMRFEAGQALLALDGKTTDDGVEVRRALFEVPDIAFPLDVSGGALRFQNKRLTLRAVELAITWDALFVPDALRRHGLTLLRERSRAGGLELIVAVDGPSGPVPLRARVIFAPVGDGGVALVLHEIIGFVPLPRRRLELAPALLDALRFPGGLPARAMIRRAEPFRAVFSRLLPNYGWKVPSLGDVRVHEAVLGKGEVILRAWSGKPPEGWKAPRDVKKGPLQDAISLAVFADGLVNAGDVAARLKLVDRLVDERALSSGTVPFAAEILRGEPRRAADGEDLIRRALENDDGHLGLLSAWAEAVDIEPVERARRLLKLSAAADANDEPWVAGRAALAAAHLADDANDVDTAIEAASAAVEADPSVAEAGMVLSRLLIRQGDLPRALGVGRAALERIGAGSLIEAASDLDAADGFAIELAAVARQVDGIDAARLLLRRALRARERADALVPLVELEIEAGALERAAEGLTRLLVVVDDTPAQKKHVELLAARLAEERGDRDGARAHLLAARDLDPRDARVALRLSRLAEDAGDLDRALESLTLVISDHDDVADDVVADVAAARFAAARLLVRRAVRGNRQERPAAERARVLLAMLPTTLQADPKTIRLDAEARAVLGDPAPLAEILLVDAAAHQDRREATALRRAAARHFLDADAVEPAAVALAEAFVAAPAEAADIVVERVGVAGLVVRFAAALGAIAAGRDDVVTELQGLARRLAAAGRPREAFDVLVGQHDRASRELRASCAADANDVEAEIGERRGLLSVVEPAACGGLQVRLAVLLARLQRHGESADAWLAAAAADATVDTRAWQAAAVAVADPVRLAVVLGREDGDDSTVESALFRAAIPLVEDGATRRRLLASLASRNDEVGDVERWLEAARQLPAAEAARAFIDAARSNRRAEWLLEGFDLLVATGDTAAVHAGLEALATAGDVLLQDVRVADRALAVAVAVGDVEAIQRNAARLLARTDLDVDAARAVRRREIEAWRARHDRGLERAALAAWLDGESTLREPLTGYTEISIDAAASDDDHVAACARLARARNDGADDDVRALVVNVADAARERGIAVEANARELLLGFDLDETQRERTQRRLVDLSIRDGRVDRAIELLHALLAQAVARGAADAVHAGLWQRVADLEEEERHDKRAAADALRQLLSHAPVDADASRRLLALLLELHDDEALAAESLRRAGWLEPSAERTDLLLRAAGVARAAGRLDEARAIGLRAVRQPPFSRRALDEMLDLAKVTSSRRLAIRARLAAAAALEDSEPLESARQAAEAGGLLAGMLRRLRLGIAVFTWAEQLSLKAGVNDGSHTRMLVELCRALGDGEATVHHLGRLVDVTEGKERARLLEARAEARTSLLNDEEGAVTDRIAALQIDPAYSAAARALGRQLASRGDVRGALDVERAFIDASTSGADRAVAYARMSATANKDLVDDGLTAELSSVALGVEGGLDAAAALRVRRRLVGALERLGNDVVTIDAVRGLYDATTEPLERLASGQRLAELLSARGDDADAINVLRAIVDDTAVDAAVATVADSAGYDTVVRRLATLLAARSDLAGAAAVLLRGLSAAPHAAALLPRHTLLEQAAIWLDDADDSDGTAAGRADRALNVLGEAAAAGALSDDGEVRRARLAEELGQPSIAAAALDSLISRNIEVGANAQRLAVAAEAIDDLPRALASWGLALADDDTNVEAWLATERLALQLDEAAQLREAREALVQLQVGRADELAARAAACGEDALSRQQDIAGAVRWFETARHIESSPSIRLRLLDLALSAEAADSAGVDVTALAVLDEMHAAGDAIAGSQFERRAAIRLALHDDPLAAAQALVDVLAASAGGADDSVLMPLLQTVVARNPHAAADALLQSPARKLLRDAVVNGNVLDDDRIDASLVAALAVVSVDDAEIQRAAARREQTAGRGEAAVERLLVLASRRFDASMTDEANALVDDAGVIAVNAGHAVLLQYLATVRPAFVRQPALRDAALTVLRDIEAWPAVADVLEDAVAVSVNGEGRTLRLHLVSVLRDGVDDSAAHERAAAHLETMVTADVGDREAWGELFECLDHLGDSERLQVALGRRGAALDSAADQLELRQLVRRRAELLLGLGRAAEGLAALQSVRPAGDSDSELRELAVALHHAVDAGVDPGADGQRSRSWIGFLNDELIAAGRVVDAELVLALPAAAVAAVSSTLRVRARLAAIVDETSARVQAEHQFDILWNEESKRREAVDVVEALVVAGRIAHAAAVLAGLAAASTSLGHSGALRLTDALYASALVVDALGDEVRDCFAVAGFARRLRVAGVVATLTDLERLVGHARTAARLRRAARLAHHEDVVAAAAAAGVDLISSALGTSRLGPELQARAHAAVAAAGAGSVVESALGAIRHGSPRAVDLVGHLGGGDRALLARRARTLSLRGASRSARLLPRLLLAEALDGADDHAIADLDLVARAAADNGDVAVEVRALDALAARRPAAAEALIRRADGAFALSEADAHLRASAAAAAADATDHHETAQRLRRRAVDTFLRLHELPALGGELLAMARAAPGGPAGDAQRAEARDTAEAARLTDVVDEILRTSEGALVDVAERIAAVKERAALRLRRHDAPGAFEALLAASRTIGDLESTTTLRNEAWLVACAAGLTRQAVDVVDDDLARAGLLAALGRTREAVALASSLDTAAALWLIADCARADGDHTAEEQALSHLADRGLADDGALIRLVDGARHRGDIDDAARRALSLLERGTSAARVRLVGDCAGAPIEDSLRRTAVTALLDIGADADVDSAVREQALLRAAEVASLLDDVGGGRNARLALARLRDDDQSWTEAVAADLTDADVDDDELMRVVRRQLGRPAVLRGVVRSANDNAQRRLTDTFSALAHADDAARVVELLATITPRPFALTTVLADGLVSLGRQREAAEVLLAVAADGAPQRAPLLRATALLLDVGAFGAAARALTAIAVNDIDADVLVLARDVVNRAARDGAMADAARLAVVIGDASGDKTLIALALGCADAAGGDTAMSIAAARLRSGDLRSLALLAHHSLEGTTTQGFFGAWHALRSGVHSFAGHAPRDFAVVAWMADRTRELLAPPLSSAKTVLSRARRGAPEKRAAAWKQLAAEMAATDELGSARLLVRAGVPMAEAPLEVRLAVDPALAGDAARATAIAAGIGEVDVDRRAVVVAAFDAAVARGASTARERLRVDGFAARLRGPLQIAVDNAAVGEAVDVHDVVRRLGRHPPRHDRAQAAALLQLLGHSTLAVAVDPSVQSTAAVHTTDRLLALRTVDDAAGLTALGALRLSQLAGPRLDVEQRIEAIARQLDRADLLAESLMRQARLHQARDDRARALVRYADVVVATDAVAASRAARAAFALDPTIAAAEAMLRAADARDDAAAINEALSALLQLDSEGHGHVDRITLVRRQAALLAQRMLRPEEALSLLDTQTALTPTFSLFVDKSELYERLLLQPLDAALALLAGIEADGAGLSADDRRRHRRHAADLLARIVEDGERSVSLAVETLCRAFIDDGDLNALDDAEALARSRAPRGPLARVLELRLREIDDINARRELVLEHARLLHGLDDNMGAIAMLEAQAVADPIDLGARLALATWYLKDRRILDAALAFESAARIPGLPAAGYGPAAREAASLLAGLGDLERAGPLADLAVSGGVDDLEVLTVAEAWHRAHDRWSMVDELLGKELEHLDEPRRMAHVWMERAVVRSVNLADEAAAKTALHRVLELVADHPRALQMMRDDAVRADTWGALRMALFRAVDVVDDIHRQSAWLREIATIDAEHLNDKKAAAATVERALALDPDDVDTLVLKAGLMVKAGQLDGLSAVIDRIEKKGHSELPGQLHLVRGDALVVAGDRTAGQAAFRLATDDPETSSRAWDRLIDMADMTTEALGVLEEARRATVDSKRRLQLWRKELRLRTRLDDADGAVAAAEQVLQLDPGDNDALALVSDAFRRRRKLRDLLPLLTAHARAIDAAEHAAERAARLADVGVFALDELGQESAARGYFEEALGLDAMQPTALLAMADIAWASRDDERALVLLDRISPEQWTSRNDDQGQPRTAGELFLRRARCAWALGNADVRERLRQVLRLEPDNVAALDMLARVALEQHDDDAAEMALESLSQALQQHDDPIRLAAVFVEIATLRLRRGSKADALDAAEHAFDLNPGNLAVLQIVAEAREAGDRHGDAAEAWRRIAAVRAGEERVVALDRRVQALERTNRTKDAVDAWLDLFTETGNPRHKEAAVALAVRSGLPALLSRVGMTAEAPAAIEVNAPELTQTQAMPAAPGATGALAIQLRANLDAGDAESALKLVLAARAEGPLDQESARLAFSAAERMQQFAVAVDIAETRLQTSSDANEVLTVALAAGRLARDKLHDDDRAAALLYQAHQADAEDVEVRLELTELYARIPRLASHAVTGILQLLRRTPGDARVFALAADLAVSQGQLERATGLRAVETLLRGKGVPIELMGTRNVEERSTTTIVPLDKEAIATRLAPTGWCSPLHQLIMLLGVHLEVAVGSAPPPADARPLVQASPRAAVLVERIERLLPGRPVQFVIADVPRATITAGGVATVVLPRELLANEPALHAAIARGIACVRFGAVLSETMKPGTEAEVIDLLRAGLLGEGGRDVRSELLTQRLRDDDKQQAVALAQRCLVGQVDLSGTLQIVSRACDRFVLVATGSAVAALQTCTLPTLLKEPPQRAMVLLQGSVRALELCAFAARDNAWLLRRQHLLN